MRTDHFVAAIRGARRPGPVRGFPLRSGESLRGTNLRRGAALRCVLLLAGLFPLRAGFAADALPKPSSLVRGPLIRFSERSWDFGPLPQHQRLEHAFTIRNEGTEPLQLLKIEPDCGCMIAEPDARVIVPGDSTLLRVFFETREFEGDQNRVVIIETNDPAEPRVDLVLKAYIEAELQCEPRLLNYGKVRRGTRPSLSVRLVAKPGVPFRALVPTQGTDWVAWSVTRDPSIGPNAYRVDGSLRADAPFGRFNEWVEIPVEHPNYRKMRISIRGFVHAYFTPSEPGVNFGTPAIGDELEQTLRIEADGSRPYRITGATTTLPLLTASIRAEGPAYVLTVRLKATRAVTLKEKVRLTTDDPEQPVLELEVKGVVLAKGSAGEPAGGKNP